MEWTHLCLQQQKEMKFWEEWERCLIKCLH
jgi:hypothetical protein